MFVSKKKYRKVVSELEEQRNNTWQKNTQRYNEGVREWLLISAYIEELTGRTWGYSADLAADLKIREDDRERKEALARVEVDVVVKAEEGK